MGNEFKILHGDGTALSGLVTDEANQMPRECGNCIFYKHDHCHHPVVMNDPEVLGEAGKAKPVKDEWCCNFFRSPKRVLVYALRHGEDAGNHLIGGWENSPIDEKGEKDAREAARYLKDRGIRAIVCSDMKRTRETAKIVADELGIKDIYTDFRLRTLNKGKFNGQEKTPDNEKELGFYKDHPFRTIPGGESNHQLEVRSDEAFDYYFDKARECGTILMIMHNSNIKQIQRYCQEHNDGDTKKLESTNKSVDSVEPGGLAKVTADKDKLTCEVVLKERK